MDIIGIKYPGHDTSVCLVRDGIVLACVEEERFTRKKHTNEFPEHSINYCLEKSGVTKESIKVIAYYCVPELQIRKIYNMNFQNRFPCNRIAIGKEYEGFQKRKKGIQKIQDYFPSAKIHFVPHHIAHASSAYYMSDFDKAAILTIDGRGEYTTSEYFFGKNSSITPLKQILYPNSIGFVYGAISDYLGLSVGYYKGGLTFDGEGKLMALASYGKPYFIDLFRKIITYQGNGNFIIDTKYFQFFDEFSYKMTDKFVNIFGPPRINNTEFTDTHKNIACSLQIVIEECVLKMLEYLHKKTACENLCLAGGVMLNSCLNGKIASGKIFKKIFIQPAAGDAGTSLGAALWTFYTLTGKKYKIPNKEKVYLGPEYYISDKEIENYIKKNNWIIYKPKDIYKTTAKLLSNEKIIGWFQGRMELGPRALGNRSILADPRNVLIRDKVNFKIKGREWFRPLAPSILKEFTQKYFKIKQSSPYMLIVAPVIEDKKPLIPAVVHVDGTGRLQTVSKKDNFKFYNVILEFYKITQIPLVLNTSLNIKGEPICCSPYDALHCFENTDMDLLVINDYIIGKKG